MLQKYLTYLLITLVAIAAILISCSDSSKNQNDRVSQQDIQKTLSSKETETALHIKKPLFDENGFLASTIFLYHESMYIGMIQKACYQPCEGGTRIGVKDKSILFQIVQQAPDTDIADLEHKLLGNFKVIDLEPHSNPINIDIRLENSELVMKAYEDKTNTPVRVIEVEN
jgi:hypothetical protein